MNDWFIWKGQRCTEFGIHVSEQPPITIPRERVEQAIVPGRPGSLTLTEGKDVYEDLTLCASCWLSDPSQIPSIAAWLKGRDKVTFANRAGGFYYARVSEQIAFERILRGNPHVRFDITFLCSPLWYQSGVEDIVITEQGYVLNSPGSVFSEPVITVEGTGEINLMVNDATVYLDGVHGSITLDCEAGIAYTIDGNGNKVFAGQHVSLEEGEWPRLLPVGTENLITWATVGSGSAVRSVTIQPNWRFL